MRLISPGSIAGGAVRQDSSNSRIVDLSIAPTRCNADAEAWIASKASLLNLRFVVMAYLHKVLAAQQVGNLHIGQARIGLGQRLEGHQFIVLDVVPVLLGKQVLIHPIPATLGQDN